MATDVEALLKYGDEAIARKDLDNADSCFSQALRAAIYQKDEEQKREVLRALVKLAGLYIKVNVQNRPRALYDLMSVEPEEDRARLLELLARFYRQKGDLATTEKLYVEIFELRARSLGFKHEDTTGALQTAALLVQMQGKSPEELYKRAFTFSEHKGRKATAEVALPAVPADSAPKAAAVAPEDATISTGNGHEPKKKEIQDEKDAGGIAPVPEAPPEVPPPSQKDVPPPPTPEENSGSPAVPSWEEYQSKSQENARPAQFSTSHNAMTEEISRPIDLIEKMFGGAGDTPLSGDVSPAPPVQTTAVVEPPIQLQPEKAVETLQEKAPELKTEPAEKPPEADPIKGAPFSDVAHAEPSPSEPLETYETPQALTSALLETAPAKPSGPSVTPEVKLLWKGLGRSVELRLEELTERLRGTTDGLAIEKILTRPSFQSLVDRENLPGELERGKTSERIDWRAVNALLPLYEDETSSRAWELTLLYALTLRAEFLHPLHPDIALTIFRLGHLWLETGKGDVSKDGARAALVLAHELIGSGLGEGNPRAVEAGLLLASANAKCGDESAASFVFENAYAVAVEERLYNHKQTTEILTAFAEACESAKLYQLAAATYERLKTAYETVSNNSPELFDTIVRLVAMYDRNGDTAKADEYHQRLLFDLEWSDKVNHTREYCASRYEEHEQYVRAELLYKEVICNCLPTDPLMASAVKALTRVFEKWGRHRDAERLRNPWYDPDKDRPPPHMVAVPGDCLKFAEHAFKGGNLFETGQYYATYLANAEGADEGTVQAIQGLRDLAIRYWNEGKLDDAAACYGGTCEQAEKFLGLASQDTALIMHEAGMLAVQRDASAGTYFRKAYEGRVQALGPWSPDTAESAFEAALRMNESTELFQKETALRMAISAREYAVGLLEDRTLMYMQELARFYERSGILTGTESLTGCYFLDAENLPSRQSTGTTHVIFPAKQDQVFPESATLALRTLDAKRQTAGVDNDQTLVALNKLLDVYAGDSGEVWTNIIATVHLEAALVCEAMALNLLQAGDFANAEPTLATALKIRQTVMGAEHPDTCITLAQMARLKGLKRENSEAEELYGKALNIAVQTLGLNHLTTQAIKHNSAVALFTRGDRAGAEVLYKEVLDALNKMTGGLARQGRETCRRNTYLLSMGGG